MLFLQFFAPYSSFFFTGFLVLNNSWEQMYTVTGQALHTGISDFMIDHRQVCRSCQAPGGEISSLIHTAQKSGEACVHNAASNHERKANCMGCAVQLSLDSP